MKTRIIGIFLLMFSLTFIALAQEESVTAVKLDDNLYTVSGITGGNIAFLVTDDGVLVVDAGYYPQDGKAVIEAIKSITDKPVKYLVYTHFHRDHINGAAGFPENIKIIGHENIEENIINFNEMSLKNDIENVFPKYIKKQEDKITELKKDNSPEVENYEKELETLLAHLEKIKKIKYRYPDETFADSLLLKLGEEKILLKFMGNAHTSDNIVVIFQNHDAIHTGDLIFNKRIPYVIPEHGADTEKWMEVLYDLHERDFKTVIPGHGDITDSKGIFKMAEYFKNLRVQVENGIKNHKTLEEIQNDHSLLEKEDISYSGQYPKNIEAIYKEMKK